MSGHAQAGRGLGEAGALDVRTENFDPGPVADPKAPEISRKLQDIRSWTGTLAMRSTDIALVAAGLGALLAAALVSGALYGAGPMATRAEGRGASRHSPGVHRRAFHGLLWCELPRARVAHAARAAHDALG